MSKYKNLFSKGYLPNWSEEFFVTKKVKNTCGYMLLMILIKIINQNVSRHKN